jgi:Flp pilus assembly protein TadG
MTATRLWRSDSGAAAVEFALIVPLLLLLVFGIVEFGRAYNTQLSVSAAAREGVRVMAIEHNATAARQATVDAAAGLNPKITFSQVAISPATCTTGNVTLTVTYPVHYLTGFFPGEITLVGKGVMRCNG